MPILKLRGGSALSAFRLKKLISRIQSIHPSLSIAGAEYWHFVESESALSEADRGRLQQLLDDGLEPVRTEKPVDGKSTPMVLVTPRPGTISPWSSKASDIARQCG